MGLPYPYQSSQSECHWARAVRRLFLTMPPPIRSPGPGAPGLGFKAGLSSDAERCRCPGWKYRLASEHEELLLQDGSRPRWTVVSAIIPHAVAIET